MGSGQLRPRTSRSLSKVVIVARVHSKRGNYIPNRTSDEATQRRQPEHMSRINGTAHILPATNLDAQQEQAFRSLFDRAGKYEELIKAVEGLRAGFGISEPSAIARVLNKQRREFEAISALDFFGSPAKEKAAQALRDTEGEVRKRMFPDAPNSGRLTQTGRYYFKRLWASRKPLLADRLASAWLIRRFIDPEASLMWMEITQQFPSTAVVVGFNVATFSNTIGNATFQELLAKFSLDNNGTLTRIGALVHYLETGGAPVAEAAGVETLLEGARRRCNSDEELFAESEKTFDLLYEAYFDAPGKDPVRRY